MKTYGEQTYGEQFDSAMKCQTKEEAELWMEREVSLAVAEYGQSPEEALGIIRHNLGYMAGYYSENTATKIRELFGASHPGFAAFLKAGL